MTTLPDPRRLHLPPHEFLDIIRDSAAIVVARISAGMCEYDRLLHRMKCAAAWCEYEQSYYGENSPNPSYAALGQVCELWSRLRNSCRFDHTGDRFTRRDNEQIATYMASIGGLAETDYDEGQQEVRVILRQWVLEVI